MNDRPPLGYRLKFADGPAEHETIETSIPPAERRWYCQAERRVGGAKRKTNWWVIDAEPPRDEGTVVTEYVRDLHPMMIEDAAVYTYTVA